MSFVGRHNGTAVADGVVDNARMNKAGEALIVPWEVQMMLEGRVFVAGTGVEEAGVAGIADLDDQTPVFGLVAPAGGVVVIPKWFRVYYDTEAGAAAEHIHLIYVQKEKAAFSAGTEMAAINCLGGANPRTAQGKLQYTLTSLTAITNDDNVPLTSREHILDDLISAEMAAADTQIETLGVSTLELIWRPTFPIGLYYGAALYFYGINATSRFNVSAAWIEVPEEDYLPEE